MADETENVEVRKAFAAQNPTQVFTQPKQTDVKVDGTPEQLIASLNPTGQNDTAQPKK